MGGRRPPIFVPLLGVPGDDSPEDVLFCADNRKPSVPMTRRVNLDAMIPREDFAIQEEESAIDLLRDFPIGYLASDNAILKLLRKPDFQRETNHWTPDQIATFVASFVDNEVIPSLILWRSPTYVFVIDGGHRLSALRAWMLDDYGDGPASLTFYKGEISDDQKRVAKRTRRLIEQRIGRFTKLKEMVDSKVASDEVRRAKVLFTRALTLQWVTGTADVAETSFFKINSQGTPLDETEEMLIRNRRKPIAISARAILRAGAGHKYWSAFEEAVREEIEGRASDFYDLLFEPEIDQPLKTLDVPLGGSVSPVDALSLLIEFLTISASRDATPRNISDYTDDHTGEATIEILGRSLEILNRFTGNSPESLGLHAAVYFYNERGKYSRFLFLGLTALVVDKIRNNDGAFFKLFARGRERLERFLIENKSLIGIILQNLGKGQRIPRMADLFKFLVAQSAAGIDVKPEAAIEHLGLRGRFFDITSGAPATPLFSDDTKSMAFVRDAISTAMKCPLCKGLLDPKKSVSYDHKVRKADGGGGDLDNVQLVHPYCNSAVKN